MRRLCFTIALLAVFSGAAFGQIATAPPAPHFTGNVLPVPEAQQTPWTPPASSLPPVFVSATTVLFDQGLADPRGCEYRNVQVQIGNVWGGDGGILRTHGWALPAKGGEAQRFVVCWNGLVYPAVSVGGPADLTADVLATVKEDHPIYIFYLSAWPEGESASFTKLLPIKACLLLRLGHADLAGKVWTAWTTGMTEMTWGTNDNAIHLKDPYLMLAKDWEWALFDRAVCAHMRGDDRLSLLAARALVPIAKAIDAEAEKRHFDRNIVYGIKPGVKAPYLDFLQPLDSLAADEERRLAELSRPAPLKTGTPADKAARIAALIDKLENVSALPWGQPFVVGAGEDPILQALIEQGDDAVEPLLHCLETDTRLTRSVRFWREYSPDRSLVGVHEAAYAALIGILHQSFLAFNSTGDNLTEHGLAGRKQVADAIRAYWTRYRGVSLEERWYQTLQDDKAAPSEWLQAAANIVQGPSIYGVPTTWISPNPNDLWEAGLQGEALRGKRDPSVSELMERRAADISRLAWSAKARLGEASPGPALMAGAAQMALDLGAWDPHAAQPVLKSQIVRLETMQASLDGSFAQEGWLVMGGLVPQMTLARLTSGDRGALMDYASWLHTVPADTDLNFHIVAAFEPLWRYPHDPSMVSAAQWLFNAKDSPWNPLHRGQHRDLNVTGLLQSPMLGVPEFREQVLRDLEDRSTAGAAKVSDDGFVNIDVTHGWSGGETPSAKGDPLAPPVGSTVHFRNCDLYAWEISNVDGAPRTELYWPETERNKAAAACADFLRHWGSRLEYTEKQAALFRDDPFFTRAHLSFPRLDHPASAAQVKQGLAIFSLEGEGKARVVRMPEWPRKARWITLKDYPVEQQVYNHDTGKTKVQHTYLQEGVVWQAEEVYRNGKWERYYGFAGSHRITRVPAAEVRFLDQDLITWIELGSGLAARLDTPGWDSHPHGGYITATRLGVGFPVVAHLWLANQSGADITVPADLYRKLPGGRVSLRRGVRLHLYRQKGTSADEQVYPGTNAKWDELPLPNPPSFRPSSATAVVPAGDERVALEVDLAAQFHITQGGNYRLDVHLTPESGLGTAQLSTSPFNLAPPAKPEVKERQPMSARHQPASRPSS